MRKRIVAAAIVAAASLPLAGASTASAATSTPVQTITTQATTVSPSQISGLVPTINWWSLLPKVSWHSWRTVVFRYNSWQTRIIATGAGGAAGFAVKQTVGFAVSISLLELGAMEAISSGKCLQLTVDLVRRLAIPSAYNC